MFNSSHGSWLADTDADGHHYKNQTNTDGKKGKKEGKKEGKEEGKEEGKK